MRIALSGANGLVGGRLAAALRARGDEVIELSRSAERGAVAWQPSREPAPAAALEGSDAVVHLAGEPIAQRWTTRAREAIRRHRRERGSSAGAAERKRGRLLRQPRRRVAG